MLKIMLYGSYRTKQTPGLYSILVVFKFQIKNRILSVLYYIKNKRQK